MKMIDYFTSIDEDLQEKLYELAEEYGQLQYGFGDLHQHFQLNTIYDFTGKKAVIETWGCDLPTLYVSGIVKEMRIDFQFASKGDTEDNLVFIVVLGETESTLSKVQEFFKDLKHNQKNLLQRDRSNGLIK